MMSSRLGLHLIDPVYSGLLVQLRHCKHVHREVYSCAGLWRISHLCTLMHHVIHLHEARAGLMLQQCTVRSLSLK